MQVKGLPSTLIYPRTWIIHADLTALGRVPTLIYPHHLPRWIDEIRSGQTRSASITLCGCDKASSRVAGTASAAPTLILSRSVARGVGSPR